jgi:hypothetical protein
MTKIFFFILLIVTCLHIFQFLKLNLSKTNIPYTHKLILQFLLYLITQEHEKNRLTLQNWLYIFRFYLELFCLVKPPFLINIRKIIKKINL